jgi:hypothetical protein
LYLELSELLTQNIPELVENSSAPINKGSSIHSHHDTYHVVLQVPGWGMSTRSTERGAPLTGI